MKRKHSKKPFEQRKIALGRIETLFKQANLVFKENPGLANRYVTLARKISMRYKVKLPSGLKRKVCKHCYKYLFPSVNCRVRSKDGKMVYYCLNCRKYMRIPYK